jgi:NADH-quinone oxidoreductase subunit E
VEQRLDKVLAPFDGARRDIIPILQRVQDEFGYLPEPEMLRVARFTGVPETRLYGVASFYAQFRFEPTGDTRIQVCRGSACHVKGARQVLDELSRRLGVGDGETTPDRKYTLETVACIGCCALAPCMTVNEDVRGRLTRDDVADVIEQQAPGDPHDGQ